MLSASLNKTFPSFIPSLMLLFIPVYCTSLFCARRKEGNVLLSDELNTFYLRLYAIQTYGKEPLRVLLYASSHRQVNTAFVTPVVYLLHTFCFYEFLFFYYIPFFFMNIIFLIKNKFKGDNSIRKRKGDSPLKQFIQIILLHGFDVCITIVRLNRYVIN